jgi:hypothetical protein
MSNPENWENELEESPNELEESLIPPSRNPSNQDGIKVHRRLDHPDHPQPSTPPRQTINTDQLVHPEELDVVYTDTQETDSHRSPFKTFPNSPIDPSMDPQMDPSMDPQMDPLMDPQIDPSMDPLAYISSGIIKRRLVQPRISGATTGTSPIDSNENSPAEKFKSDMARKITLRTNSGLSDEQVSCQNTRQRLINSHSDEH